MALDNGIIIDKVDGCYKVASSSTYPGADVSQSVIGLLKIEIDTGSGYSTFYNNTNNLTPNYTIPIDGVGTVGAIDNVLCKSLAKDASGNTIKGDYRITFSETYDVSAAPVSESQEITFTYSTDVSLEPCLEAEVSCAAPFVNVVDAQEYKWTDVTPVFEESKLSLAYPATSGQPTLSTSEVPLSIETSNVWTKGYTSVSNVTALYALTGYSERISFEAELNFEVLCLALCDVLPCLDSLKSNMDAAYGVNSTEYEKLNTIYLNAMSIVSHVMVNISCAENDKTSDYIKEIKELINQSDCECECSSCDEGVSTQVKGSSNSPSDVVTAYIGVGGTNPVTSDDVLALDPVSLSNNQLTLNTGTTETKFKVCVPSLKPITNVTDTTDYPVEITGDYVEQAQEIPVDINGVLYNYKIYVMDIGDTYGINHTHLVTTN